MIVGERLRQVRESKNMSQGDIERKTGLLRCYVSRVENGHTVPSVETLEKMARAMEIKLHQLFYEEDNGKEPEMLDIPSASSKKMRKKDSNILTKLSTLIPKMEDRDKVMLVNIARKMTKR
jgi:transcriptional regulator with XRE-family HTH domain